MKRCPWGTGDSLMIKYHDEEWGTPVHDEKKHFEFLLLECMQAGLSWSIVLKKRENMRRAFDRFDYRKIAKYGDARVRELLENAGIIRNRRKIEAAIGNAQAFMAVQKEFNSFDAYIWNFVKNKPIRNKWKSMDQIPVSTELSDKISRDLKQRGFRFVGSTTIYAHMQAIGLVNDHLVSCFRYKQL
ncbi:MAG: DNA-3-methyladenine glycosylase I [Spirochaetales bacterium]|nr:DNA-3-methyladenine glycosylase I [Spirochaetales bacterium]